MTQPLSPQAQKTLNNFYQSVLNRNYFIRKKDFKKTHDKVVYSYQVEYSSEKNGFDYMNKEFMHNLEQVLLNRPIEVLLHIDFDCSYMKLENLLFKEQLPSGELQGIFRVFRQYLKIPTIIQEVCLNEGSLPEVMKHYLAFYEGEKYRDKLYSFINEFMYKINPANHDKKVHQLVDIFTQYKQDIAQLSDYQQSYILEVIEDKILATHWRQLTPFLPALSSRFLAPNNDDIFIPKQPHLASLSMSYGALAKHYPGLLKRRDSKSMITDIVEMMNHAKTCQLDEIMCNTKDNEATIVIQASQAIDKELFKQIILAMCQVWIENKLHAHPGHKNEILAKHLENVTLHSCLQEKSSRAKSKI